MSSGTDGAGFLDGSREAILKLLGERVEETEQRAKKAGEAFAVASQEHAEAKLAYERATREPVWKPTLAELDDEFDSAVTDGMLRERDRLVGRKA